jgi:hypothetical protein
MDRPESTPPAKPPAYGIIESVDSVTDVVLAACRERRTRGCAR